MAVVKRGKSWAYTLEVGEPRGMRRQKWVGGFPTKRAALLAEAEARTRRAQGTYVETTRETFSSYLTAYLERIRPPASNLDLTTWESYATLVRTHVIPRLGRIPLQKLEPEHLDIFYADLLRDGRRDGTGGLSRRTVAYIHVVIHRALKDAVRKRKLAVNVAEMADPPRQARTKPQLKVWTEEELRAFLAGVREDRLFAAYFLAATTGMRRSELLGLPWEAVDLQKGVIAVRQALVASLTYEARLKEMNKTQAGRRAVAIDPGTVAVIRAWQRRQVEESRAWGAGWEDSGLVFTREDGSWIHPETFSWWFDRHVKRLGLPRITVHGLRHTHVTLGLLAGIDPKTMAQRVGHASIKFMYDTYAHLIPGQDEQAARTFSERVLGADKEQVRPAVSEPLAGGEEDQ